MSNKITSEQFKIPPHDTAAEQATIGSILIAGRNALLNIFHLIAAEDFYLKEHQAIYGCMLQLHYDDQNIDLITVSNAMQSYQEKIKDSSLIGYLAELSRNTPSVANINTYAKIVKDYSMLRNLYYLSNEIQETIFTKKVKPNLLLETIDKKILSIFEKQSNKVNKEENVLDLVSDVISYIDERMHSNSPLCGIATGYSDLDGITSGLQKGSLTIIAARPGMGKTTFAMNLVENIEPKIDKPILIFSIEMASNQLIMRMMAAKSNVNLSKIRNGSISEAELQKLSNAAGVLAQKKLIFFSGSISIDDIRVEARRLSMKYGGIGAIVVDYLQLMRLPDQSENRTIGISEISRGLKELSVDMDIPVIALAQLNRSSEHRLDKRPMLSDLRDSGSIEQDADLILFLYKSETQLQEDFTEVIIGKQRNGPTGSIKLKFVAEFLRFESYKHPIFTGYNLNVNG